MAEFILKINGVKMPPPTSYQWDLEDQSDSDATRTEDGTPYVRKVVTFEEKQGSFGTFSSIFGEKTSRFKAHGVKVAGTYDDTSTEGNMVYDPAHPDADENGYVTYPNVNIITEMTNLIDASRSYEANATAFDASKAMAMKGLQMGK